MKTLWKITDQTTFTKTNIHPLNLKPNCFTYSKYGYVLPQKVITQFKKPVEKKARIKTWLKTKIGQDFKEVHSAFKQEAFFEDNRQQIFWYVEKKEAILLDEKGQPRYKGGFWYVKGFYVHPETNQLCYMS